MTEEEYKIDPRVFLPLEHPWRMRYTANDKNVKKEEIIKNIIHNFPYLSDVDNQKRIKEYLHSHIQDKIQECFDFKEIYDGWKNYCFTKKKILI